MRTAGIGTMVTIFAVIAASAHAQTAGELKRMSLEELADLNVRTVSRAPEATRLVPAAIHVITQEDIRRSGAHSIPEALRLAPGVQVARISAGTYAIGIRGFADRLARSMLVLIDGRAVYNPLFAGTYWETQDLLLDDVEQIEVIRGPGGTLWGANAVNGIINIITKPAAATRGTQVMAGSGTSEPAFASVRYGAAAGDAWNYRVYAKAFNRTSQYHADGLEYDGLRSGQGGFRADWSGSGDRSFSVHGDIYDARLGTRPTITTYTPPYGITAERDAPLSGGNVVARYALPVGRSRVEAQAYYMRSHRDEIPVAETRDTFDLDLQQTAPRWRRHQFVWGVGYRLTSGDITAIAPSAFTPETRTDHLYSAFGQDDLEVVPSRLRVIVGTKVEHNDYSGGALQPGARLLWTPATSHSAWASVTRAVRTPSRVETDYTTTSLVSAATPTFVRLLPNPDFRPETTIAYEAGYRARPLSSVSVTLSGFYNALDDVLSTDSAAPFVEPPASPSRLVVPVSFRNTLHGNSKGAEVSADVRATDWWRWTGYYAYVKIDMIKDADSRDVSQVRRNEGLSPRHQVFVQSSIDIAPDWTFDASLRHVSALPAGPIAAYTTADVRLAWRVHPTLELAVVGRDLGQAHHVEWPSGAGGNIGIRRSAYVSLAWQR